jgi:rhodanese-related sulfurtransferase
MNKAGYFEAKLEATISPMDYKIEDDANPNLMILVDVRNAPPVKMEKKIKGAKIIPQRELAQRLDELPKNKLIVVYCWDVWCNLAAKAAITLIANGYNVKELSGGIAAWNIMQFPTEEL